MATRHPSLLWHLRSLLTGHGIKYHSQNSWKGEEFLLASQGSCQGREMVFLGMPFAPLPFSGWRLHWLQSCRDCGKELPSLPASRLHMHKRLCVPAITLPSLPALWEGLCPWVSYTITNQEEQMHQRVNEAPRTCDLGKGTSKLAPQQPSYWVLCLGQALC